MGAIIKRLYIFTFILCANSLFAQSKWSLEKCIQVAMDRNLTIKSSQIGFENAQIDASQAKHARYPNLSASTGVNWNFGRTIDPTRNEFITETFFSNNFNVSSSVVLYNGDRINNSITQSNVDGKAFFQDIEQAKRNISLNVATLYLNILFAKENVENAEKQLALTKAQLLQLEQLIRVGNRPENDRLDLVAQIATNEQNIVETKNNLEINFLNLKQLMRLEPNEEIDIETPSSLAFENDPDLITFEELYRSALTHQASIAANELRVRSAELGEKISFSQLLPSIGARGGLATNYSNKGFSRIGSTPIVSEQEVIIGGNPVTVGFPQEIPVFAKTPYFDQFNDNISYNVGVFMSIPIYNNNQARAGLQRSKLNTERAMLNLEQEKETLKITVGQALIDAKAAKSRYQATEKTKIAQTNLYENAVKRFEIGNINAFELTRLKTQMETAEINFLIAKFNYFFRSKVLDFYLGKPIVLSR